MKLFLDIVRVASPYVVGYLVGAIPFSLIVGKRFYGIDPREHGSGNLGATNVFRTLGARAGLTVFVLDVAKGAAAVALSMLLCPNGIVGDARDLVMVGVAAAAILGHSYSPYIRFKGGKGVATAAGAIAVMMPYAWPILFLTFLAIVAASRMVALGSVIIAVQFPILMWFMYRDRPVFLVFAILIMVFVIVKHRSNIVRIARGQENRISLSGRGTAKQSDEES